MRFIFLFVIAFMTVPCGAASADGLSPIRSILKLPDNQIDLAKAKLTVDKMIDPTVNIKASLKKIDSMVAEIQMGLLFQSSSSEKLQALRAYLYTANNWNGHQPYGYDFSDPYGKTISHKLLPNYLASKKGNCVSMPFLFVILGQRLGIEVTAATAPEHIFAKFKDESGNWISLETTSGANPARDIWIRQQNPMTDESVANGIYLRPLSKKETVALMVDTLIEDFIHKHQYEKAIEASDLVLEYHPKSVEAMLHKGYSYGRMIIDKYASRYSAPNLIPPAERADYEYLDRSSLLWYTKAEALGWRMPTDAYKAQYKQTVNRAKLAQ